MQNVYRRRRIHMNEQYGEMEQYTPRENRMNRF